MPPRFVWTEYKRRKIIQRGSFATIYKATRLGTSAQKPDVVAIKIATPLKKGARSPNNSPEVEASFLRALAHPHTITLLDTIPDPQGAPALVLEYCPTDLFSLLVRTDGRLPIRAYLKQLLTGVAHFHAHNTVHCDLKPENILINRKGVLKICDFGFAETISSNSLFKGTREYLAPEYVWDEALPHSPPTDIWSVGCIFYMLLTQESLPFASLTQTNLLSDKKDMLRYTLESIFVFLDPFPVQPSGIKPYPADLMSRPRAFKFFSSRRPSWKHKLSGRGVSSSAIDLLAQFWEICPSRRIVATKALTHPFFFS